MYNLKRLWSLAESFEEKVYKSPINDDLINNIRDNLIQINVPMTALINIAKTMIENGPDSSEYDIGVDLYKLARQYEHLYRKFK